MQFFYTHEESTASTLKEISARYKHLKRFIDLGCGTGRRTAFFNEYRRDVIGMDKYDYRDPEHRSFRFIRGNIFKNDLTAESFDMVLSYDVIEHLEDQEMILREAYRLLKPRGIKILGTPNRYRIMNAVLLFLGKRKYPYCISKDYHAYPDDWHITEFSTGQLTHIIEKNGFKIIEHHKIYYGIPQGIGLRSFFGFPFYHNHIYVLQKL